jgi:hypothetical protein
MTTPADAPPAYRPWLADAHEQLAAVADELLANCEASYPTLIQKEKVTAEDAERTIRALRCVVDDRRRILDLLAGNQVGPRNDIATPCEKEAALEAAQASTFARYQKAQKALHAALSKPVRAYLAAGLMDREDMIEARRLRLTGWNDLVELDIFLHAEQHYWAVEALLWHQHSPHHPCFYAELTADVRRMDREAAERRAA